MSHNFNCKIEMMFVEALQVEMYISVLKNQRIGVEVTSKCNFITKSSVIFHLFYFVLLSIDYFPQRNSMTIQICNNGCHAAQHYSIHHLCFVYIYFTLQWSVSVANCSGLPDRALILQRCQDQLGYCLSSLHNLYSDGWVQKTVGLHADLTSAHFCARQ